MAINGVSGAGTGIPVTFRQLNAQAAQLGDNAMAARMHASRPETPKNGDATNIGTSEFQKTNNQAVEVTVEKIAEIMQKDDKYTERSNSGTQATLSPTGVMENNNVSVEKQDQIAAASRAYSYFR